MIILIKMSAKYRKFLVYLCKYSGFFPLLATSAKVVVVSLLLVEEFLCSILTLATPVMHVFWGIKSCYEGLVITCSLSGENHSFSVVISL